MRAALRDAKIAAAKAEGRPVVRTTLKQRQAARRAEQYAGWRVRSAEDMDNPKRQARHNAGRLWLQRFGRPMSGRQFVKLRKRVQRRRKAEQAPPERAAA